MKTKNKIVNNSIKYGVLKYSMLIVLLILLIIPSVIALTGFTEQQALYYTGDTWRYRDVRTSDGNIKDVGIELCGHNNDKYVSAFYALNAQGLWHSVSVTYEDSAKVFTLASIPTTDPNCYYADGGFVTVSPYHYTGTSPEVYMTGWPGRLYIGYAGSSNPGSADGFEFAGSNAFLQGSFSIPRSFDQTTRSVTYTNPSAILTINGGGAVTKSFSTHISDDTPLVLGLCNDDRGANCPDGEVVKTPGSTFVYDTGLSSSQVNDQTTHTKYAVANGLGYSMCIGANLKGIIYDVPSKVYYSTDLKFNVSPINFRNIPFETNGGNVDVTSTFKLHVEIYRVDNNSEVFNDPNIIVSQDVLVDSPSSTIKIPITWQALGKSGMYEIKLTVDSENDIKECVETDNIAKSTFELLPITLPDVYIDGNASSKFPISNIPYNLTLHMKNSDDDVLRNSNVSLIERNGLSITFPVQTYERINESNNVTKEKTATFTESRVTMKADYNGNLGLTVIPSYNSLYDSKYYQLDLSNKVGNYGMYISGYEESGEEFKFVVNKTVTTFYPLNLGETDYSGVINNKDLVNEVMVAQVLDFLYKTYVNFLDVFT